MKFSQPITRGTMLFAIFAVLLTQMLGNWLINRFMLAEGQNRILSPDHFDVQVLSDSDFLLLADPSHESVELSDGSRYEKAPVWYEVVLPGYKTVGQNNYHVLVTTKGTAHVMPYLEQLITMLGLITCCGLALSIWNLKLLQQEIASSDQIAHDTSENHDQNQTA